MEMEHVSFVCFKSFFRFLLIEWIVQTVILPVPIGGDSGDFPHTCTCLYLTTKVVQEIDASKYILKEKLFILS
jgi:hypothetical protein